MPRLIKSPTQQRTNYLTLRLTFDEKSRLQSAAEIAGLSVSEIVRRCVDGRVITAHTDMAMINELRRLSGLVKLLHRESGGAHRAQTAELLIVIKNQIAELCK